MSNPTPNTHPLLAQLNPPQAAAVQAIHGPVLVMAGPGSGKTRVLVDRVIRLLLDGAEPSKIMCLTFTKAAAAEMSNRLFERLSAWVVLPQPELRAQLAELGVDDSDPATLRRALCYRGGTGPFAGCAGLAWPGLA